MAEKRTTSGTTKKTAAKTTATSRKAPAKGSAAATKARPAANVTAEQRWRMIADAAFYRAERRGFSPGGEVNDWLEAEAEIEALLAKPKSSNSKRSH
ncbi:DUF2934 domain-containing protein [Mangrovitalea sediminis]|uniref:DUF2934 domain-containing protein n=1 Tax=Mangrovitalea sediminis TaxID=1982043 RepID=UPI000BE611D5|nr:DUF2934 domain-containing protein [Mangrovitalea sediminis]